MGQPIPTISGYQPLNPIGGMEPTRGTEPSQYPQEEKATAIPPVAASERGSAQTDGMFKLVSVVSSGLWERTRLLHEEAGESETATLVERSGKIGETG